MAGNFWQSSHFEQWIMEKNDLARGRAEDMKIYTEEEYQRLMIFFANLMQQIGTDNHLGKVRMQVIATACVYFKRFYIRRSFKDIDPFLLAPACLFLASKVEEHGMLSTNKLMTTVATIVKKMAFPMGELSMRVGFIHEAEFILLEILDCCLIVYQPYRPLRQLLQDLRDSNTFKDLGDLEQTAVKCVNDSLRTDVSLLYAPHIIAIGCLQMAILLANREKEFTTWFAELTVDYDKVYDVVQCLTSTYKQWKIVDEKEELKKLLDRLPKANPSPPQGMAPPRAIPRYI